MFAHMDDETISSYGTIRKFMDDGAYVILCCVCGNGHYCNNTDQVIKNNNRIDTFRRYELDRIVSKTISLDYYDLQLDANKVQNIFDNIISTYKPDIVITHWSGDLHFEHRLLGNASLVSCRRTLNCSVKQLWHVSAPMSKWAYGQFNGTFSPNLFIDISKYKDNKLKMLQEYSNSELSNTGDLRSIESIMSYDDQNGCIAGVKSAEAYLKIFEVI